MPKKPVKTARRTTKTGTAAKRTKPAAVVSAADPAAMAEALAKATRLSTDEVLRRALAAFAASHGLGAPAQHPVPAAVSAPAPAPAAATAAAAPTALSAKEAALKDDSDIPALAPPVRLYVHGNGRPPQEMINDTYLIGSSPRSDLWVNMPKIDTKHVRISRAEGGTKYLLEDLGTDGGTFINGERINGPIELKNEDSVFLAGYHRIRFYLLS